MSTWKVAAVGTILTVPLGSFTTRDLEASDWPMWRRDPGRTAVSPDRLPRPLRLQWTKRLRALKPAFRSERLGFDRGHEPIVVADTLYVASSTNDALTAIDVESGHERWRFHADGPIRFAPVAGEGRVWFGSDGGSLWCLDAGSGDALWRFRAAPTTRKDLGNSRQISTWPVRGGPVLHAGRILFAAGVWPFEGAFVYCLDATTGAQIWVNDRAGFIYGQQPHNAQGFGGLTPQGYLLVDEDHLVVPCGAAYPARFDLATGKLVDFALPRRSRLPGGWFAAVDRKAGRDLRRGRVKHDTSVNRETHEDNPRTGIGSAGIRSTIELAGKKLSFQESLPGVDGTVHSMLVAAGRLFVVTRRGDLHCFGEEPRTPLIHPVAVDRARRTDDEPARLVGRMLAGSTARDGYAVVLGLETGRIVEELALRSRLDVVAFDDDRDLVERLRRRFDRAGLHGKRVSLFVESEKNHGLPPYFATLVTSESASRLRSAVDLAEIRRLLRPFGGVAVLRLDETAGTVLDGVDSDEIRRDGELTFLFRRGALPGTTNYAGGWAKSADELVRSPFGVVWFDDTLGHFKRSPQPRFVDGIMISRPKEWRHGKRQRSQKGGYKLLPAIYSNMYTGRVLTESESATLGPALGHLSEDGDQPSQYRPPTQKNAWKPEPPRPGRRIHPLTLREETRSFPKSYGCDGGVDYGNVFTMRSATAAVYDKRNESGTFHISGPRSGCTNSVIPAGGLLNVPYFYEGCTCSYPLPCGLALVHMPPTHEQWTSWGGERGVENALEGIRRVGINLGAPGDRMAPGGTLWLDSPSVGGPSPRVEVEVEPANPSWFYRHSMWTRGGRGWPWVSASGAEGLRRLEIRGLQPGDYAVRLYFSEPRTTRSTRRSFDVEIQGEPVVRALDVLRAAGGVRRSLVEEYRASIPGGTFEVRLVPRTGEPVLCGVELIAANLDEGEVPELTERDLTQLELFDAPGGG